MRFVLVAVVVILALAAIVIFVIPTHNQTVDPSIKFEVTNPWCQDEVKSYLSQFTSTEIMPDYFIGKIVVRSIPASDNQHRMHGEAWVLDNIWGQIRNHLVIVEYGTEVPCLTVITVLNKEILGHGIAEIWLNRDAKQTLKYEGITTKILLGDGLAALYMGEEITEDFGLTMPLPRWDGTSTPNCEQLLAIKWLKDTGRIYPQGNESYLQGCR